MDKLRIGIIGTGNRGVVALAAHWNDNQRSTVMAGADVSETKLLNFRKAMGDDVFTTFDYRDLLDRNDIDCIAVSSPDHLHEEHIIACLEAGKHVFCEKPLAVTVDSCDRVIRAQKATGKKVMMGFNMRYIPMFETMKEIVDSGAIGQVKAVWVRHFVGRGSLYYYHNWHANRQYVTSLLLQKGSHDIDIIHWIAGSYSKRVAAFGSLDFFGGDRANDLTCPNCPDNRTCTEAQLNPEFPDQMRCVFRKEVDVEDNNVVMMNLENGVKAAYLECHFTPDYHRNYVFIGTEGSMENSEPDGKVWVRTRKSGTRKDLADRVYEVKPAPGGHSGGDPRILEDFLDFILLDKKPAATLIDGRMSVAVGCAATESLLSAGMPQDIPPIS